MKRKSYPLPPGWTPDYTPAVRRKVKRENNGKPRPIKAVHVPSEHAVNVIHGILKHMVAASEAVVKATQAPPLSIHSILGLPPHGRPLKKNEMKMAARKVAIFTARQKGLCVSDVAAIFNARYHTVSIVHNNLKRMGCPPDDIVAMMEAVK